MGKYFTLNNIEDVSPDSWGNLLLIMSYLEEHGRVSKDLTYTKLERLWMDWNENKYCASFMNPDNELIEEFAEWLDKEW